LSTAYSVCLQWPRICGAILRLSDGSDEGIGNFNVLIWN